MSEFVLVPLDGSSNAENAVPFAVRVAELKGLPLRFIHVAEGAKATDDLATSAERFSEYVSGLAEKFGFGSREHTSLLVHGAPAARVLEEAERAGFIVIATHGRGGFKAIFLGSVADKVVRGSAVPVFVVPALGRPEQPSLTPIVVALDGSEEAEAALTVARELHASVGGKLILVRAYGLPAIPAPDFGYYPPDMPELVKAGAEEYLDEVAAAGEVKQTVQSNASDAICTVADQNDAGLVVMAASGKGLAGRLALGSTTDRVIHALQRPILVLPAS